MRIFIDTNILLDYICRREPFFESARVLIKLCIEGKESGIIAAHSIINIDYISKKQYSMQERRFILENLCKFFEVETVNRDKLVNAVKNADFSDLEDGIQYECALIQKADYIITRNPKDFKNSIIPILSAE